ncbi:MAG: beta-1,6-N-acetylglucosaminyltransferase [Rhodobacteraceae bacterium]|nr:beta-1,6-N-acetylglucosaminyltransferase [Paracoccaceae bacterium]
MTVGVIMLVHTDLDRAAQVARHWAAQDCPVVMHVDRNVGRQAMRDLRETLADLAQVRFSRRHRCDWGGWGIVAATLDAAADMLGQFAHVRHVYLASGTCLPLRPVAQLRAYLAERPDTDFIESATTAEVPWPVGGLDAERFTMWFPFSWRRRRMLFDLAVGVQRRLGVRRRSPAGLVPHMGSQWWCLTRDTLNAILTDPDRAENDRFFRHVWIPDESYFQTLARRHARRIESRSLTLSKFDFQGKPHIFYDDHLQLLRRSDCFVARKIWPRADRLYAAFLGAAEQGAGATEPAPGKIDRAFARAVQRRTRGRAGLYMQSRFPNKHWENGITAAPYSVFQGFDEIHRDFMPWLARTTAAQVHGHLFAPLRAEFAEGQSVVQGALPDSAARRDYAPRDFLTSLIWNTRGTHQCFQFGPGDVQDIAWALAEDRNAQISVVSGAWAVPLFRAGGDFADLRIRAARLQGIESAHLNILRSPHVRARVRIWTLAEYLESPSEALRPILAELGVPEPATVPALVDLTGFGGFLQKLKNEGMHPFLMGDFPPEERQPPAAVPRPRAYVAR